MAKQIRKIHTYFRIPIILALLFVLVAFNLHKFHLSNTKVVFNTKEQAIQITIRCFIDDIEKTVSTSNVIALELGNDRELSNANTYLEKYISDNFILWINNQKTPLNYLGKEEEKDIIYFYLEVAPVKTISSIKIENTILLQDFSDQQNIIRIEINNTKKTFVLKNKHSVQSMQF